MSSNMASVRVCCLHNKHMRHSLNCHLMTLPRHSCLYLDLDVTRVWTQTPIGLYSDAFVDSCVVDNKGST